MTLLDNLSDPDVWREFLEYKVQSGNLTEKDQEDLRSFISKSEYKEVTDSLSNPHMSLDIPGRRAISKMGSSKKRIVYTYPRSENYILKLLTFLLLRKYDRIFAPNLYSFRVRHGAKEAIEYIRRDRQLDRRFVYKIDIQDYFNSVDISLMLPILKDTLSDDPQTYQLIASILTNLYVRDRDGNIVEDHNKGIMAGVPLSSFLANLYLNDMDHWFFENGNRYARYSDDIIIFASSEEELQTFKDKLYEFVGKRHLQINPKKVMYSQPGQTWNFLGVSYQQGIFDISEVSYRKIIAKMRRKYRALIRWRKKKDLAPEKAAKAFVKTFNNKFYEHDQVHDLTWTRWFFPIINTDKTLRRIDHYMQDCIRYIMTEKRTNRRFNCRYTDIKALGYRSLVNEFYKDKEDKESSEDKTNLS